MQNEQEIEDSIKKTFNSLGFDISEVIVLGFQEYTRIFQEYACYHQQVSIREEEIYINQQVRSYLLESLFSLTPREWDWMRARFLVSRASHPEKYMFKYRRQFNYESLCDMTVFLRMCKSLKFAGCPKPLEPTEHVKSGPRKFEVIEPFSKIMSLMPFSIRGEMHVIVCRMPIKTNYILDRFLFYKPVWHSDGSAAIEWEDGYKLWYLNGVEVPQYLAETPAGKLNLDWYLQERNADVRAQFILKYGIDRMSSLGKVVDSYKDYEGINEYWKKSEYELIDMAPIHNRMEKALYLKMKNQTVDGIYHLEGVSNDCKTIYDAIKCRWNGIDPSQYVTINIK